MLQLPPQVQVYERYSTKADFTEVHQKSEPYLAFKASEERASIVAAARRLHVLRRPAPAGCNCRRRLPACLPCALLPRRPQEQQGRWRADHAVQVTGQSYIETGAGFHR